MQSVTRKLGDGIQPLADRIMTLILQLIQAAGKTSTILEDAFLVVGSLASSLEQAFSPYIQAFLPFLYPALKAFDDTQLCTVAVGVIGDICRALGEQSAQYASAFMGVLLEDLSSEVLNRDVKVSILSCFGDIALAIGPAFEPYMQTTMGVLRQAGSVQPNPVCFLLLLCLLCNDRCPSSLIWIWSNMLPLFGKVSSRRIRVSSRVSRTPKSVRHNFPSLSAASHLRFFSHTPPAAHPPHS